MPVKYGITAEELFKSLGLELKGLTLDQVEAGFNNNGLALIYQPDHFPLAESLISYRDEIGKRPPLASLELLWTAHQGEHLLVSGFVHPPTENRAWKALELAGEKSLITVKGLEGSTDLPISRACVMSWVQAGQPERLILHPRDHGCFDQDIEWNNIEQWSKQALEALNNRGPLSQSLRWNAGTYLWLSGQADNLADGIHQADACLKSGAAKTKLDQLIIWRSNVG